MRAIGDPRAVPALIRAIPKTLLPSSSDYGLTVIDKDLMDFMLTHDLRKKKDASTSIWEDRVREIIGALHSLTGQHFQDAEPLGMCLSEDPRRQVLQRRIYQRDGSNGRRGGRQTRGRTPLIPCIKRSI